jgi:uncharacterized membrane protein YfcA
MRINDVIRVFAALIGTTTTFLGAWAYIRSQHTPRKEMFRAALAIMIIMITIWAWQWLSHMPPPSP